MKIDPPEAPSGVACSSGDSLFVVSDSSSYVEAHMQSDKQDIRSKRGRPKEIDSPCTLSIVLPKTLVDTLNCVYGKKKLGKAIRCILQDHVDKHCSNDNV